MSEQPSEENLEVKKEIPRFGGKSKELLAYIEKERILGINRKIHSFLGFPIFTEGWVPTYGNPDNKNLDQAAEPIEVPNYYGDMNVMSRAEQTLYLPERKIYLKELKKQFIIEEAQTKFRKTKIIDSPLTIEDALGQLKEINLSTMSDDECLLASSKTRAQAFCKMIDISTKQEREIEYVFKDDIGISVNEIEYREKALKLHVLIAEGLGESDEAEELRDAMDYSWNRLSESEIESVKKFVTEVAKYYDEKYDLSSFIVDEKKTGKFWNMINKPETPKVGVAVILEKDGKVLMMQRKGSHGEGCWSLPGGHMELGETFLEVCKREIKEEVDLDLFDIEPFEFVNAIFEDEGLHYITLYFIGKWDSMQEVRNNQPEKIKDIRWVEPNDPPRPTFNDNTLGTLKKFSEKKCE